MVDASLNQDRQEAQPRRALPPLEEAIQRAQSGDKTGARELLRTVIRSEPTSEEAWVWLSWVADDDKERIRYLQEAQALLPSSERVAEALAWAIQQRDSAGQEADQESDDVPHASPGEATAPDELGILPETSGQSTASVARDQVGRAVEATQHGMERAIDAVKSGATKVRLPKVNPAILRRLAILVGATLLAIAVVAVVWTGVRNARQATDPLKQLPIPTRVADATATPTIEERTGNLWVQVDVAWTRQDWDAAIDGLQRIREIDPYSDEARMRLGEAHYYRGLEYVENSELEKGRLELDTAIRVNAKSADLQQARHELGCYMTGLAYYNEQDWSEAVANLGETYETNPGFRDTAEMLGQSSYQRGLELEKEERWYEAQDLVGQAKALLPGNKEVEAAKDRIDDIIIPPKRIEVDISDKICTLYENHQVIYQFRVCTGRATAPTVPGNYEVLDKLPMAYASKWDLDMPWWLGIYWAGGSENGFHALPLRGGNTVLWSNSLGTGCSFGCIVLDTADAKILYDWAEIGDKVIVTY